MLNLYAVSTPAFLKLGVAEQFLRGREMQLIFESTPGCLLKFNIKFKFKFILHSFWLDLTLFD